MNKKNKYQSNKITSNSVSDYLNNKLNANEIRDLEDLFTEDPMLVDAIEGLRLIDATKVGSIDQKLKRYINKKVVQKNKQFGFPNWLVVTIILLLLLISIAYLVIVKLMS